MLSSLLPLLFQPDSSREVSQLLRGRTVTRSSFFGGTAGQYPGTSPPTLKILLLQHQIVSQAEIRWTEAIPKHRAQLVKAVGRAQKEVVAKTDEQEEGQIGHGRWWQRPVSSPCRLRSCIPCSLKDTVPVSVGRLPESRLPRVLCAGCCDPRTRFLWLFLFFADDAGGD